MLCVLSPQESMTPSFVEGCRMHSDAGTRGSIIRDVHDISELFMIVHSQLRVGSGVSHAGGEESIVSKELQNPLILSHMSLQASSVLDPSSSHCKETLSRKFRKLYHFLDRGYYFLYSPCRLLVSSAIADVNVRDQG